MSLPAQIAIRKLEEYLADVKTHPSLVNSPESSFINDFLRTFQFENGGLHGNLLLNSLSQPNNLQHTDFTTFFDRLPNDQQYSLISFLNFDSILALSTVNQAFHSFLFDNGLLTALKTSFGSFLAHGDPLDAKDMEGKW